MIRVLQSYDSVQKYDNNYKELEFAILNAQ